MKTLAELKQMNFIPHHDCACCSKFVGWYVNEPNPWFDPSCDCGSGGGHYDTLEKVFKWYNTVFEKETEDAAQATWNKEAMALNNEKLTTQYIRSELEYLRQEVNSRLNMLLNQINDCEKKSTLISLDIDLKI